jgi:hypothetical protein
MNKLSVALFGLSFSMFCAVAGFCLMQILFPFGVFRPAIACDAKVLELGTVNSDAKIDCRFEIKNMGNRQLLFREVVPACGSGNDLENLNFSLTPLKPGELRECSFLFRPRLLQGDITKKVVVFSNDPKSPRFVLSLHVTVVPVAPTVPLEEPTLAP